MTTQINQLTELTTTSDDDLILIREDSTGIDKKMKAQNIRAKATTKDDVGLGNVTNDAQFKLADAGTMATQNANDVAVTGGTINNTPIGGTTASTGAFTTASASTSVTTPLITRAGNIELSATGANLLDFKTNGQDRMRITSDGNVGIGTTAPDRQLHVEGGARINGTLNLNGTTTRVARFSENLSAGDQDRDFHRDFDADFFGFSSPSDGDIGFVRYTAWTLDTSGNRRYLYKGSFVARRLPPSDVRDFFEVEAPVIYEVGPATMSNIGIAVSLVNDKVRFAFTNTTADFTQLRLTVARGMA